MTLEELIEKMLNFTDVGIRCSSIEERDELGDFLSAYVKGQRTWTDGARKDEMIVFWSDGDERFETSNVRCSGDLFYEDIVHLLGKEQAAPVIVDDLI